jgi:DNA transformation protein and related proteins
MNPETDTFCQFVFERLGQLPGFRFRRMFGGVGLYAGTAFIGLIDERRLYFRVNDKTRPAYVDAGMDCFRPTPKQALKSYYEVPANVLENDEDLLAWARAAIRACPRR